MTDTLLLTQTARTRIDQALAGGAMVGGWLVQGPPGIGKGALALSLATTLLSGGTHLGDTDQRTKTQVSSGAHPDLFTLRPGTNEKTGKARTDITVDEVRSLIASMRQTATGARRVAIVNPAEAMNRQAANALLKVLEEPPRGAVMLLLTAAPGRLLPTIRSRCRRLALGPVAAEEIRDWLIADHHADPARAEVAASASGGRPGAALALLDPEARAAQDFADQLIRAAMGREDLAAVARAIASKDHDPVWAPMREAVLGTLAQAIRGTGGGPFTGAPLPDLLDGYDAMRTLDARAAALNSDRAQTAYMMGLMMRDMLKGHDARR